MKNKLYIFLSLIFFVLIFNVGSWGLTESSEARYAQIGKEMFTNNDYLNPTLLGIKHFHKPPATYYLTSLGYKIFGINEFGARIFLQVALVFQLFFVFKITLLLYKNEKLAFAASLIYFSFPITVIAARNLTTDTYLTTFVLASIFFWLQYKEQVKPYFLYLFYFFLGLIFETKGPVGFIVPVTFIITHKIVNKEKIEVNIHQFFGFFLFLLILSVWYLTAIYKNEGLLDYFINNQFIERVAVNKFKRRKPFWYYMVVIPLFGLPWLFYLIFYFKKNIKAIIQEKKTDLILLVTFLALFIILSISTSKLLLYVLPLFSILAIFSAKYLSETNQKTIKILGAIFTGLILILTLTILIASFIKLDIKISRVWAVIVFLIFSTLTFILNKNISKINYLKPAYLSVLFILMITISSNHIFKQNELKINSVKPIAEFIKINADASSEVLIYNYLLPSLSFYLNKDITTINHGRYTTQRETQFETNNKWAKHLINYFNEEDRLRILNTSTKSPVFLIKRKKDVFPDTLLQLQHKLKHKKEFKKFEVYY